MVIKADWIDDSLDARTPNVVVVDPHFDAYRDLAASARSGRIGLHFRSSGTQAIKLARHLQIDAWLVADELDDMSGCDFVSLLGGFRGDSKVAMVRSPVGGDHAALSDVDAHAVDAVLEQPISVAELEELLGMPAEERSRKLAARGFQGAWAALPVSVGAAVVAIALLMIG